VPDKLVLPIAERSGPAVAHWSRSNVMTDGMAHRAPLALDSPLAGATVTLGMALRATGCGGCVPILHANPGSIFNADWTDYRSNPGRCGTGPIRIPARWRMKSLNRAYAR
jgi:hypothetical protein